MRNECPDIIFWVNRVQLQATPLQDEIHSRLRMVVN